MDANERRPYQERAKNSKKGNIPAKLASNLVPLSYIEKRETERQQHQLDMLKNIKCFIANAEFNLEYQNFHIIHINTFMYRNSENRYYPAEIAICRFNLMSGVEDVFHSFCNPGRLPLGYASEVQKNANESHQLEIPVSAENNLRSVLKTVVSILSKNVNPRTNDLPYVYALPNNLEVATSVLTTMRDDFGFPEKCFTVYCLSQLFWHVRNSASCQNVNVFPTVSLAALEIEKDVYDYTPNISCNFHEVAGAQIHCSKSIVTRMAYMICDHCCKDLKIKLVPGKHVPLNAAVTSDCASAEKSQDHAEYPSNDTDSESACGDSIYCEEMSNLSYRLRSLNLPVSERMDFIRKVPGCYRSEEVEEIGQRSYSRSSNKSFMFSGHKAHSVTSTPSVSLKCGLSPDSYDAGDTSSVCSATSKNSRVSSVASKGRSRGRGRNILESAVAK